MGILEGAPHACACVVNPPVDAAEGRGRGACQLAYLGRIGYVGRHRERTPTERLAISGGLFEQLAAPGGEDHVGPAPGESLGGCKPYAARGAGDHHCGVEQAFYGYPAPFSDAPSTHG